MSNACTCSELYPGPVNRCGECGKPVYLVEGNRSKTKLEESVMWAVKGITK